MTSLLAYSDDDGASWTPSEGAGIPGGVDHQTVASGPYPALLSALSANPLYGNAVYYCSQDLVTAFCSRSDDGGITFAPPVAIYGTECAGIHGHVKVAPDGTVYVPNNSCVNGGVSRSGVAVSEDAGLTWTVRIVPTAISGQGWDPSVGIAKDGTVYFGFESYDNRAHIAVSHDKGKTWQDDTDVAAPAKVQNIAFPAVVAGDGERAAYAFLGTETRGNPGGPDFPGEWYLYIATTYDGGKTWVTQNATPKDPVQRAGGICAGGITCSGNNRNLKDFFDATVDKEGRILVGYADGCIGPCVQGGANSFSAQGSIVRQTGGPRMYAEFDKPKSSEISAAPASTPDKQGHGLLLGAFGLPTLFSLIGLGLLRRRV